MKRIKRVALLLAVALLLCSVGVAASARGSYLGQLRVVNCASWVTLRQYASTNAPTVSRVPLGAWVEGYYYDSQFTECYYNGMHGYILSTYLTNGSSGSQAGSSSAYLGKKYIVNCNEFVTLRRYASTSAPTVTKVALGQQVDAYYYDGRFCRCFYNGMEGYILSQYLSDTYAVPYQPQYDPYYYGGGAMGEYMGTMHIVNCNSWVTLRSGPSTSAGTVTRIGKGMQVEAYWYNYEFAECYYNGMHGYILLRYLG